MAVPCMRWIGERIAMADSKYAATAPIADEMMEVD
jgi:hypothetical protein